MAAPQEQEVPPCLLKTARTLRAMLQAENPGCSVEVWVGERPPRLSGEQDNSGQATEREGSR